MLHSSKDHASWEVFDFIELFRADRIRCTKVPRIAPAVVEILGSRAFVVTMLNKQARGLSFVMAGHSRSKNGVLRTPISRPSASCLLKEMRRRECPA